jgi:hypothetical protein
LSNRRIRTLKTPYTVILKKITKLKPKRSTNKLLKSNAARFI